MRKIQINVVIALHVKGVTVSRSPIIQHHQGASAFSDSLTVSEMRIFPDLSTRPAPYSRLIRVISPHRADCWPSREMSRYTPPGPTGRDVSAGPRATSRGRLPRASFGAGPSAQTQTIGFLRRS